MAVVCKYIFNIGRVGTVYVLKLIVLDGHLYLDIYQEVDFRLNFDSQENWADEVVVDPVFGNNWLFAFRRLLGTLRLLLLLLLPDQCLELLVGHSLVVGRPVSLVRYGEIEQSRWVAEHPLAVHFDQTNSHAFVFLN